MKMNTNEKDGDRRKVSASFATGAIALAFLAIGYQTALFIHRAAVTSILAGRDSPDTVFVLADSPEDYPGLSPDSQADSRAYSKADKYPSVSHASPRSHPEGKSSARIRRKDSEHDKVAENVREKFAERSYESFRFDPNTASVSDLQRLGFTLRQAQSIDNYRSKGGRFRRKEDFAKSYVVEDSVYERLAPFIDIPKLDINAADSADFDALPGIGPYFASKMVSLRSALGGYSCLEQLTDIRHFDSEKLEAIHDLVKVGPSRPFRLWQAPEDSLALHPYIGKHAARGIVVFRENHPKSDLTIDALAKAGVLSADNAAKLSRCRLTTP